jgi:hypothetical protein
MSGRFYCHQCHRTVRTEANGLACPNCQGEFLEAVGVDSDLPEFIRQQQSVDLANNFISTLLRSTAAAAGPGSSPSQEPTAVGGEMEGAAQNESERAERQQSHRMGMLMRNLLQQVIGDLRHSSNEREEEDDAEDDDQDEDQDDDDANSTDDFDGDEGYRGSRLYRGAHGDDIYSNDPVIRDGTLRTTHRFRREQESRQPRVVNISK